MNEGLSDTSSSLAEGDEGTSTSRIDPACRDAGVAGSCGAEGVNQSRNGVRRRADR